MDITGFWLNWLCEVAADFVKFLKIIQAVLQFCYLSVDICDDEEICPKKNMAENHDKTGAKNLCVSWLQLGDETVM